MKTFCRTLDKHRLKNAKTQVIEYLTRIISFRVILGPPISSSKFFKVEKILIGSLDLIPSPSPSVKIQIMGRKVWLRCKGKTLLGIVNNDITKQCFALSPQVNFPANNLNFHWRWLDQIQTVFSNLYSYLVSDSFSSGVKNSF